MPEDIRIWLKGNRNYAAGVQLYLKYGKDSRLRNCFIEPIETEFKRKKLHESLKSLLAGTEPAAVKKHVIATTTYLTNHQGWPSENQDEILSALREQWRPLYSQMSNLQARLHDVALLGKTDVNKKLDASKMASEIIDLDMRIRKIYATKSYYLKHGVLPGEPVKVEFIGDDQAAWARRETVKRYLRTLANQLSRSVISDIKNVKWLQKWNDHVAELKSLNERFKRPENEGIPPR